VSDVYRIKRVDRTDGPSGYYQVDRDGVMVAIFTFADSGEIDLALSRASAAVEAMRELDRA
jgi:hypothetical protein